MIHNEVTRNKFSFSVGTQNKKKKKTATINAKRYL